MRNPKRVWRDSPVEALKYNQRRFLPATVLGLCIIVSTTTLLQGASFEVATIKTAVPDAGGSSGEDGRNGLLKVYNVSLRRCIRYAYGIPEGQIFGGAKWVDDLQYDIAAKADFPASEPELLNMLQPLLAERFKLALHRETRQVSGYVLAVAKGGIKAKVSDRTTGGWGANGGRGRIDTVGSPMSELTIRLSGLLGRPVADSTNEARRFDFHLRWTPDDTPIPTDSALGGPSLFTALEEQAGLKLLSQRVPAEVLVIDHADLPSEN
jgi:uncharacterized protein (TIGR03435 family)